MHRIMFQSVHKASVCVYRFALSSLLVDTFCFFRLQHIPTEYSLLTVQKRRLTFVSIHCQAQRSLTARGGWGVRGATLLQGNCEILPILGTLQWPLHRHSYPCTHHHGMFEPRKIFGVIHLCSPNFFKVNQISSDSEIIHIFSWITVSVLHCFHFFVAKYKKDDFYLTKWKYLQCQKSEQASPLFWKLKL